MATDAVERIFVYPTDTVWGIGASIYDEESNRVVRQLKNSADDKPLSVLFDGLERFRSYFSLPKQFEDGWLARFFSLETTVLLPLGYLNRDIPKFVLGQSRQVGCRVLMSAEIKRLVGLANAPITTTSLNLSGQPPILNIDDADIFVQKYVPDALMIKSSYLMSGHASTIVSIGEDGEVAVVRNGSKVEEVLNVCRLLSA